MDDDVQYLGTKLAVSHDNPCQHLSFPLSHTPSVGITLQVDKCGDKPAHHLTFYRARSGYVNIGRKSGSDDRSMRRENDDHNVVFTCQVVSARHAKLVLSDSGQVYIVDLHSRHGTHLSRRGETTHRTLQPEVETLLADGDVLTFGKVVGAGSHLVSPVRVRVELLTPSSSSASAADRVLTSIHPPSPTLEAIPRKLSSGRYGLISAAIIESDSPQSSSSVSVSSDAPSSPSELHSDVEDDHECIPSLFRGSQGKIPVKIPAFRSFIGEICHHASLDSPAISDITPDVVLEDVPGSAPSPDVVIPVIDIEPYSESRSHSPIDLVTSPPPGVQRSEPAVIGAWPASRPDSPCQSSLEVEAGQSEVPLVPDSEHDLEPAPAQPTPRIRIAPPPLYPGPPIHDLVHCLSTQPTFFSGSAPFSNNSVPEFLPSPVPPPPLPTPSHRLPLLHSLDKVVAERANSEIKGSMKKVEDRIIALQESVDDLKSRQTVTEEEVVDLQSHVDMLEPDSERLLCRITGAERNIATLSMLQGQMTALQSQVTSLRARVDAPELRQIETPDDVRACASALNSLVTEMKALREDVEKRIEGKMEMIQSARSEALDVLKGVVAEAESMGSSKRKRGDEKDEGNSPELVPAVEPPCSQFTSDCIPLPEASIPQVLSSLDPVLVPEFPVPVREVPAAEASGRPRKRARTAIHSVAQTAAAMAIGAAATWSALAFS